MRRMLIIVAFTVLAFLATLALAWLLLARPSSGLPVVTACIGKARIKAEIATSMIDRARGLSYRDELPDGHGMLFEMGAARRHSFWMQGMRFPIDIVWLRDGVVVDVTAKVDPQIGVMQNMLRTYSPDEPADEVLELPAGYAFAHGIVPGVRLTLTDQCSI